MANGDPLRVGLAGPPDNRASSATVLVHNGSVFGDQSTALWVQRVGTPVAAAAIRGDNFSTGNAGGQQITGVMGVVQTPGGMIGVLGAASGQPNVMWGEIGVMGATNSFGVVGRGFGSVLEEGGQIIVTSAGVIGECNDGIGVQGVATTGFGVIGQSNQRAGVTGASVSGAGVEARSQNFHALVAEAQGGAGVLASSSDGPGVAGESSTGYGVEATTNTGLAALHASAGRGYGVYAESKQGVGILAQSPTNAIQGVSNGPGPASIGVAGISDQGAGVQGYSNRIGVAGNSAQGAGGWFSGRIGLLASSSVIAMAASSPQGTAGYFDGALVVKGSLSVTGAKSAVVKHKDGSHRALFCLEAPESMLQDFGEAVIKGDVVSVKLPSDFAPLIRRGSYQVFLTSYGPEAAYVRKRTSQGFEIARIRGDKRQGSLRVGYCIVGARADLPQKRLPKVNLPKELPKMAASKVAPVAKKSPARTKLRTQTKPLPPAPKLANFDLSELVKDVPRAVEQSSDKTEA